MIFPYKIYPPNRIITINMIPYQHTTSHNVPHHTPCHIPQVVPKGTSGTQGHANARRAMTKQQVHKSMPSGRQSRTEYRFHTVPTPQVHKSMRAGASIHTRLQYQQHKYTRAWERATGDDKSSALWPHIAVTTNNTTSTPDHTFRAAVQEEQARDERW